MRKPFKCWSLVINVRFSNLYLVHHVLKRLFRSYNRRQELLDCVTHMRLLAWLLHGSLSHFVHCQNPHVNCHPVKFEENTHIADYVLIILFSFAEQLKVCFKIFNYFKSFRQIAAVIPSVVRDWFQCVLKVRFTACRSCSVLFLSDYWTRYLALSFIIHKEYQLLLMIFK